MANGQNFTVPAAVYLAEQYRDSTFKVFYDHGVRSSQRIHSWFGPVYAAPKRDKILAWIDIVIADPTSGKVHKIIEIEDSTAKPKTLIGDLMAVLLGDGLAFADRSDWQVGKWTSLTVLTYTKTSAAQMKYRARLAHVQRQIAGLQPCLTTRNAAICHLTLETFKDIDELKHKLDD